MSETINLHLNIFNSVRTVPCPAGTKLSDLEDYLTVSHAIEGEGGIYAKVTQLKRPLSELEGTLSPVKQ